MEARIIRDCDMFGRVITFWKTNSADIPAGSKGATYSANLGIDRQKLVDAGATQKGGKVTAQNALLLTLDTDLQAIARTAHAIAQDVPGFDDLFLRRRSITIRVRCWRRPTPISRNWPWLHPMTWRRRRPRPRG
jgi:hypothetical protein